MIAQVVSRSPVALLVALLVAVAACAPAAETDDPGDVDGAVDPIEEAGRTLRVVVTTSVIGDIIANIAEDDAEIEVLMPPGADPHQFEASPGQRRAMEEADVVVANGLELEVRLTDVLDAAERDGARVVYLFEGIDDPIELDDDMHDHGHDHADDDHADDGHAHDEDDGGHDDHGHGEWDPHVWFDPVRTAEAVRALGVLLDEVDDSRPDGTWSGRVDNYVAEILATHAEIEEILARIPDDRRKMLTNHEAFGYLADRYGLEVVGAIIPGGATLAEPTAREFRELAELIRTHDLPAIFAETTSPTRLAEALAGEVGRDVEVVVLYSESLGEPGSGAETYLGMLRVNAQRIAEALGG